MYPGPQREWHPPELLTVLTEMEEVALLESNTRAAFQDALLEAENIKGCVSIPGNITG